MTTETVDFDEIVNDVIGRVLKAGADAADALFVEGTSLDVSVRFGELEDVERSFSRDLGLRAFVGKSQAVVSTTDFARSTIDETVERVVAMARAAPEDPHCGLADPAFVCRDIADLDLGDTLSPDTKILEKLAESAEEAALRVDGVTNSEGGGASASRTRILLVTSDGFHGGYDGTSYSVSCSVLAGEGTTMERDYDFDHVRHLANLRDPIDVGRQAGERAVRRLRPRKAKTAQVPVVYDPRVANSLVGHFAAAINGTTVARGTSFLRTYMDKPVFADGVVIVDDPHRRSGLRSKPFDGEGVRNGALNLIEDGRLTTWVLDCATSHQLGLETNGRAARGTGGPPSPATTNLYMKPGTATPDELIADIAEGFYVTELMGMGINGVTGDYSRGAAGFWIENGRIAYPVSEVTVAGNLKDMFLHSTPANDLEFRYGANAPTLRVEGMTVAGS